MEDDEPQEQLKRDTAPVVSFQEDDEDDDDDDPHRRLSPDVREELAAFDDEIKGYRMRNPVKIAYEFVEKWLPPKEKKDARRTVMPPKIPYTGKRKKKAWSSEPPPNPKWARMIAVNKAATGNAYCLLRTAVQAQIRAINQKSPDQPSNRLSMKIAGVL